MIQTSNAQINVPIFKVRTETLNLCWYATFETTQVYHLCCNANTNWHVMFVDR